MHMILKVYLQLKYQLNLLTIQLIVPNIDILSRSKQNSKLNFQTVYDINIRYKPLSIKYLYFIIAKEM